MIQALIDELTSGEDERAQDAVTRLAALGASALPALRRLLTDGNAEARWWALWALAEIRAGEASLLLLNALQDNDLNVRQAAALALQRQPDGRAIPLLVALLPGPDALLARLAGNALVAIGAEAVPALLEVMQNGSPAARLEAVRALALIGDVRAIPVLFSALEEESALIEFWATQGLERMGVGMVFFKP